VTGPSGLRRFVAGSAPAPPAAASTPPASTPGPATAPAERCEMCATDVPAVHGHVADLDNATLACVCRACYLLFTESGAGGGRYRGVPDRYLADPARPMAAAEWDSLQIPVGLAFFLRSSRSGETHAFYPSPAGATESTLDLAAWARLTAGYPLLGEAQPDTEAVLICRGDAGAEYYLVPIDACYELAGRMRLYWRGFDGGAQARAAITDFLADVRSRARDLAAQAGNRGGARA
jgi:Family of unknown function (DUF5947)